MEQRERSRITKVQAKTYAEAALTKSLACTVKSIRFIGGGSFGHVFEAEIDKAPFCVVMKGLRADGLCEREADELRLLAENSAVRIPEVYFTFLKTHEIPMDFIGMEKVGGTNCFTDFKKLFCSKKEKAAFAVSVCEAAHNWHLQTNDKFGLIGTASADTWLEYYRPFAEEILKEARSMYKHRRLGRHAMQAMELGWKHFNVIFSEQVAHACLIHGDLNVMNIMSDDRLHLTAVIDPLESKWADPEYELFQMRNLTGNLFHLYETYKSKYHVSEKCDVKTAFYALYHEVYTYIITGSRIHYYLPQMVKRFNKEMRRAGLK